jgi:MFS family permease
MYLCCEFKTLKMFLEETDKTRGIGGLFWIVASTWWGRAPVMFWSTLAGVFFTLACAVTDSFSVYYGFRAMMGFTLTAYQVVGLACVKDMFYFHEHARKIGIWVAIFILSPYLGPLFANFIIAGTGDWRITMWLCFAVGCLDLIGILLICDETVSYSFVRIAFST